MGDYTQVIAYANGDFRDSVQWYIDTFFRKFLWAKNILDIGCGPADVPIGIALQKIVLIYVAYKHKTTLPAILTLTDYV